jgi:phosphoenolpyruvate carboxykinase (ATP)
MLETKERPAMDEIRTSGKMYRNLSVPELYEHAVSKKEAEITAGGALCARTGKHTARSPRDRFVVKEPSCEKHVWWSEQNEAIDEAVFDRLLAKVQNYLSGKDVYQRDCYAGSDPKNRLKVRVYTELAWHSLFARHLLIDPPEAELGSFVPDFTVISVPGFHAMPQVDNTRGSAFILLNLRWTTPAAAPSSCSTSSAGWC